MPNPKTTRTPSLCPCRLPASFSQLSGRDQSQGPPGSLWPQSLLTFLQVPASHSVLCVTPTEYLHFVPLHGDPAPAPR
jgi:hypothetical protein